MYKFAKRQFFNKMRFRPRYCSIDRPKFKFDLDLKEEIVESHILNIYVVGINKPEQKNVLNDSALKKLHERLKSFDSNDQFSVLVLHGIGGNFCTGIHENANRAYAEEILKDVSKIKKPMLASLTGFSIGFGFQLAMLCDLRVMEKNAFLGLGHKCKTEELFPFICERLIATAGISSALELVLMGTSMCSSIAMQRGIINKCCEIGAGLGNTVNIARGVAKYPLENLIEQKKQVLSWAGIKIGMDK